MAFNVFLEGTQHQVGDPACTVCPPGYPEVCTCAGVVTFDSVVRLSSGYEIAEPTRGTAAMEPEEEAAFGISDRGWVHAEDVAGVRHRRCDRHQGSRTQPI